jgi:autotransporter-associated beta strand protein
MILASNSTITAPSVGIGGYSENNMGGNAGLHFLKLGAGTNTINTDTLYIGSYNNSGRSSGAVSFNTNSGCLLLKNAAGTGRANIHVVHNMGGSAGNAMTGDLDLSASADAASNLQVNDLYMAGRIGYYATATMTFRTGTLDVNTLTMSKIQTSATGTTSSTLNLNGGAVTFNTGVIMGVNLLQNIAATATATMNIAGAAVTSLASSFILGNRSGTTAGNVVAALNITAGSLKLGSDIKRVDNLFGTGTASSTITLNGGTLDMGGYAIGSVVTNITLNAQSGTLKSLGKLNGDGGLVKSGAGKLSLDGANAYSGGTTNGAGLLVLLNAGALGTGKLWMNGGSLGCEADLSGGSGVTNDVALLAPSTITNASNLLLSGVLSGTGGNGLTKAGAGVLTLSASNTYSGATMVSGGTLALSGNGSIASSPTITVASGAALNVSALGSPFTLEAGQTLQGSGTVTGNAKLSGNVYPGSSGMAGTLNLSGNVEFQTGSFATFDLGATTTVGGSANDLLSIVGDLNAAGELRINPTAALDTQNSYRLINYTGARSGTFSVTVLGSVAYTATLNYDTPGQVNVSFVFVPKALTWNGTVGSATWDQGVSANWLAGLNPSAFTNADAVTFDGTAANNNVQLSGALQPYSVEVTGDTAVVFLGTGKISGATGVVKGGSGTLTLGTTNDYTGTTAVNAGKLVVTNASSLGSAVSGTTVASGATLELSAAGPLSEPLTLAGVGVGGTEGALRNTLNATVSGPVALSANAVIQSANGVLTLSGGVSLGLGVNAKTLTLDNSVSNLVVSTSPIAGDGVVVKTGAFATTVNVAGTYTGGTEQQSGDLVAGVSDPFGSGSLKLVGGTLRSSGTTPAADRSYSMPVQLAGDCTLGSATYTGIQTFHTGAWTLSGGDRTLTVNSEVVIQGAIGADAPGRAFTKAGTGILKLFGLNTYEGITLLANGTLEVSTLGNFNNTGGSNLGRASAAGLSNTALSAATSSNSLQLVTNNSKTLRYVGGGETSDRAIYLNHQISSSATIDASGTGALVLGGPLSWYTGNATGGNGLLILTGDNRDDNSLTGTFTEKPNWALNIQKNGPGTWSLTGDKNFNGITIVNQGILKFDSVANRYTDSALGTAKYLRTSATVLDYALSLGTAATAGTLLYTGVGNSSTDRALSLNGNGTLDAGAATGVGALTFTGEISSRAASGIQTLTLAGENPGVNTFSGLIKNGTNGCACVVALTKSGAGKWILSGTNTYTGATTVASNGGTLLVNGDQSAATGLLTVNTNATFGGTGTVWQAVVKAGGRLAPGAEGVGTLSVSNLIVESGAHLVWDIAPSISDKVAVGALTLPSSGKLYLDATVTGGTVLGGKTLFTYQTYSGPQELLIDVAGIDKKAVNDAGNKRIYFVPSGTMITFH